VLALAAGAVAGCASASEPKASTTEGTWTLQAFGGAKSLTNADPEVKTELTLSGAEAKGNGGVNSFSATYEAKDGGKLKFGDVTSTLMAGSPTAQGQEERFFKALKDTRRFTIDNGKLILLSLDNDTLAILVKK
jgi:heat shock protein HslJ